MPKIVYLAFDGERREVLVETGTSVMEGAVRNNVPGIDGDCGGNCACATCHVYVDPNWRERVGARNSSEQGMLSCVEELRDNSRLACQITVTAALDGIVVNLPEAQH